MKTNTIEDQCHPDAVLVKEMRLPYKIKLGIRRTFGEMYDTITNLERAIADVVNVPYATHGTVYADELCK